MLGDKRRHARRVNVNEVRNRTNPDRKLAIRAALPVFLASVLDYRIVSMERVFEISHVNAYGRSEAPDCQTGIALLKHIDSAVSSSL